MVGGTFPQSSSRRSPKGRAHTDDEPRLGGRKCQPQVSQSVVSRSLTSKRRPDRLLASLFLQPFPQLHLHTTFTDARKDVWHWQLLARTPFLLGFITVLRFSGDRSVVVLDYRIHARVVTC